mmetsp:Transcript_12569/g.34586  ORF Transcript_12569/g.34586 Transcript_12569/m.34586 type:complete len:112 (+) Transcript_12569:487-822(+)
MWQWRVERVNRILRALAHRLQLPLLDAHAMTLPRSDATQDGVHYWRFQLPRPAADRMRQRLAQGHDVDPDAPNAHRFIENEATRAIASALLQLVVGLACPAVSDNIAYDQV